MRAPAWFLKVPVSYIPPTGMRGQVVFNRPNFQNQDSKIYLQLFVELPDVDCPLSGRDTFGVGLAM